MHWQFILYIGIKRTESPVADAVETVPGAIADAIQNNNRENGNALKVLYLQGILSFENKVYKNLTCYFFRGRL